MRKFSLVLFMLMGFLCARSQHITTDTLQLKAVTVTGERPALRRQADKLVVPVSGNRLFSAAANAFDVLKKVPELTVNGDGSLLLSGRVTPAVFVDGKPVPMSPEELQTYLAGLSSDMIASIEVITNPSSRYDGEYKGIIDIKLKKDRSLGWKGNAGISLQRNSHTLADNTLSLTYKTKKLLYTARLGYTAGNTIRRYFAFQHLANTNIMATSTETVTGNSNFSYQLGADYNFRKDQQIGIMFRAYRLDRPVGSSNTLHTTDATALHVISDTHLNNQSGLLQHNYAGQLSYAAHFGKTQLEMLGTLASIRNRQHEDIQNWYTSTGERLDYWKTVLRNDIMIRTAQIDLTRGINKKKLAAGAKFAFTTTQNDLRYDTLNKEGGFTLDSGRTNNFRYDEYITAAYASYEGSSNKWSYVLSLRLEHTHTLANTITLHEVNKRDYLKWLPALNLNYSISDGRQLNFSYSRRLTRPNFAQLNPFRFYFSPLNYWVGNPHLQPSTTDMLNIAYTDRAFNISLQIGREWDPMSRYPEYDPVTNVLEYLGRNLPYNDFAGLEVSFPLVVNKWWRMTHSLRGDYRKEQTPYHGVTYAIPITDYTITGSQVFTLPGNAVFDISYSRRSLSGNGLYVAEPLGYVDIGLQKTWLKGKLNTKINYYDLFDTYRVKWIFREKKIIDNELAHWFGARKVALTLNYSFGASTHKGKQGTRSEEESRAGM
jgi:hypothetical protein